MSSWKKTSRHCSINLQLQLNISNIRLLRVYVIKFPETDSVGTMSGKYLPDVKDSILGGGVADRRILVGMGWESISSRSGSARYVMSSFRAELKVQNTTAIFFVMYIRFLYQIFWRFLRPRSYLDLKLSKEWLFENTFSAFEEPFDADEMFL